MGDRRSRVTSFQPSLLTAASTADHLGQCCVMYPATMSRKRNLHAGELTEARPGVHAPEADKHVWGPMPVEQLSAPGAMGQPSDGLLSR